jgi:radical SAM-linked protein
MGEGAERIRVIQDGLTKHKSIRVKWNQPETSWLEGIFARGDRKLAAAVSEAWGLGARFDGWTEHFNLGLWREAFARTSLDPDGYGRERNLDECLPWDHIRSRVSKDYLKEEWHRAVASITTPDCRQHCLSCGVCDHRFVKPILHPSWQPNGPNVSKPVKQDRQQRPARYRLTFTKLDLFRHLGHLELVRLFVRATRRAGVPLAHSEGFHPMPKLSFACALPVGTESLVETVDIELMEPCPIGELVTKLNGQLPDPIRITMAEPLNAGQGSAKIKESRFLVTLNGARPSAENVDRFLNEERVPVAKQGKRGQVMVDARPMIKSIEILATGEVDMLMAHAEGPELKPLDLLKAVFGLTESQVRSARVIKTMQVLE